MTRLTTVPPPLLLVDGQLVGAAHGAAYPVVSPATGALLGQAPDASAEDRDAAIAAARRAADDTTWSMDPALRRRCVEQLLEALAGHGEGLRELLVAEGGVPVALTRAEQYDGAVAALREAAVMAPDGSGGVRAVLTPFTDPVRLPLEGVVAGLLAGDCVVLKPAADVPWAACELGRLAAEHTDLPPGVLQVVTTRDVDVAIGLTTDPRVDAVTFTGSAVVADRVRHQASGKRLDVSAAGAATVRVGASDDLSAVVAECARGVARHAGQACGAPARVVVPASRVEEAASVALSVLAGLAPGDPADPATVCGPVISPVHRDRVRRYLALATHEGGTVVGGGGPAGREAGFWIEPAVVSGLAADARAAHEEILGPVLVVLGDSG